MEQERWARTYARATAGKPVNMSFNPETKEFHFCFVLDISITEPTEIFASETYSYPNGTAVVATENLRLDTSSEDVVLLTPAPSAASGQTGCVSITREAASPAVV